MDPYLEGYLWPDVHAALAGAMRQRLVPLVRPRYTVRLAVYVAEDASPEAEVGIMYPDVEVLQVAGARRENPPSLSSGLSEAISARITPPSLTIPVLDAVEVRLVTVEVRNTATNALVTAIEIVSPVNKTGDGLTKYRRKRQRLHRAGVHLLELDLIRRGSRAVTHPRIPPVPYLVALTRAEAITTEVWPIRLQGILPVVPVPLHAPDADVELDLQETLATAYETAAYELSIDYQSPPPPPAFSEDDTRWMADLLRWNS
jgi:hypothetical protein